MTTLFDPLQAGQLPLNNRIIMAPMTRGRADHAGVQSAIAATYYAQRASAGLIITEAIHISPMAKPNDNTPGIFNPEQIAAWKTVTGAVHRKGGTIVAQLMHAGRVALPDLLPGNVLPVSASAVRAQCQNHSRQGMKDCVPPRALTVKEIKDVVDDFANAAANALEAGFDGVELHGAYGYLIHQFLGTNTNRRKDAYGGNDINRARFLFETIDAVAAVTGSQRVGLRLSPGVVHHDMEDANAADFYSWIVEELNNRNLAYLHIVQGEGFECHSLLRGLYNGIYFANGGFNRATGEALLSAGGADAIVYGKPFIANPDLVERFSCDAVLNEPDFSTVYTPGEKGYIDYAMM